MSSKYSKITILTIYFCLNITIELGNSIIKTVSNKNEILSEIPGKIFKAVYTKIDQANILNKIIL